MLKGLGVLENKIEECVERAFTYDKYAVAVKFNNYILKNGEVTKARVYINIYMRNLRNRKRISGTLGYFDLDKKSFIPAGYIYSSGLTSLLQEICKAIEIEIDEEALKEEVEKMEIKIKIVKISEQIEELKEEIRKSNSQNFYLSIKVQKSEEEKRYLSDIREKENLIKEQIQVLSEEREGLKKYLS